MEYSKVWPSCVEWYRPCCFINVINDACRRGQRCLIHFQSVSFDRAIDDTLRPAINLWGPDIFLHFQLPTKETCVKSPEMLGQSALSSLSRGGRSDTKNMKTGKSYQVDHSKEGQCGACLIGNRRGWLTEPPISALVIWRCCHFWRKKKENIERIKLKACSNL
jgi:hypothetical protein